MTFSPSTIKWVLNILEQARIDGLYGRVTFMFEAGQPVRAVTEKSELPPKEKSAVRGVS